MSSLGSVIYNPPLEEAKINLQQIKDLKQLCVIIYLKAFDFGF
jgi:hypothetical protein